jgi:hypothetical protein
VQVRWLFSRLLSAPGRPGEIERVIGVLSALPATDEPLAERETVIEALRQVHRELVTVRQSWSDLAEDAGFEEFPELASQGLAGDHQPEPASPAADASSRSLPARVASPLPSRGVVVRSASGRVAERHDFFRSQRQRRWWLALGLVMLVLLIAGTGAVFLQGPGIPTTNSKGSAYSSTSTAGLSRTPTSSAQTQPAPPSPVSSPTPGVPPQTPLPGPKGWVCPTGSAFCVSALQLQVSCAGAGSGTLQLLNATVAAASWQASTLPGPGRGNLTISPSSGELAAAQQVTLLVLTRHQQQALQGAITIVGQAGTLPIIVTVKGCG